MTNTPVPKGGARPGAGRTQTKYKISVAAARKLQEIAKYHGSDPAQTIEGLINNYHATNIQADAAHTMRSDAILLAILTPEPKTADSIAKGLRVTKAELEQIIIANWDSLVDHGLQLHTATHSEVKKALKLPSRINPTEHGYYSKLSRNLFSL